MTDAAGTGAVSGDLPEDSAEDLYEQAPCGYLATLARGDIVRVNETFLRWTGYRREDLVGRRRFQDLLTGGGRIYHETHYAPLLRMQGEVHEIALDIVCASGERLPVLVNSVLTTDAEGTPLGVRTTVFNAVERRRYERELLLARERTARLQRVTAALAEPMDRRRIAERLLEEIVAATGADEVAIGAQDEDKALVVVARRGGDAAPLEPRSGEDRPAYVEDGGAGRPLRALAVLPLRVDGRAVGELRYGFTAPRAFPDEERAFVESIGAQAAIAFQRARLIEESDRAARRSAYMADVSRALYELTGVGPRLERLRELTVPRLADAASIEPDDRDDVADVVARARRSGRPELAAPEPDGGSCVALPLRAQAHGFGVLVLRDEPGERRFGPADLPFLADVADRAALALENARLYEQQRDVAQVLQRSLLAGEPPRDPRFEVATYYRPAGETLEVGGDWYDCFPVSDGRVAIAVGDVVGRGIVAASAMGQLRSAMRALAGADLGPRRVLERLDTFVEPLIAARFATVAYAEIALDTGAMTYACAGHPPPLLLEAGEPPALLWDGRSPPLGANVMGAPRREAACVLPHDARLLLYTDGLVERRRRSLDRGIELLQLEFGRRHDVPLPELPRGLTDVLLSDFSGDDDVCLLCFRYRGGSPRAAVGATAVADSA
ncbi:MAG TPA: SpoIIE family protein phosphatase [Solirubrobacteraceae bacterium]|nr:SpoIIE family protein phosphatase [Solirubrobacteraceae bacterium]